jgi:hypothetical protein
MWFTTSERPKDFVILFYLLRNMTMKLDHEKIPSSMIHKIEQNETMMVVITWFIYLRW